ncbi:MAG: hypothetical protein SFV51_09820 [Bryobacteraceae bacterium]|nr:hypothetical protein [Bryobacteraceae bacterium]
MAPPDKFGKGVLLCTALIVVFQAFVPPIVGLADNADYLPATSRLYLDINNPGPWDPERFFRYLVVNYHHTDKPPTMENPWTSEVLLLLPARLLNTLLSKDGLFDLRWTGVTHGLLFLTAIGLMLPLIAAFSPMGRLVTAFFAVLVLTDVSYVSYFNSFYPDAASFVMLLLLTAAGARFFSGQDPTRRGLFLMTVCAWLFVTSKVQHVILTPPLLLFVFWKRRAIAAAGGRLAAPLLAALLTISSVVMLTTMPQRYRGIALYNVVFFHILPNDSNPVGVLEELNLPRDWVRYKGTHAYSQGSGAFDPEFQRLWYRQAGFGRLLLYYARHPRVPFGLLKEGFNHSTIYRPGFANFQKSSGYAQYAESQAFALWSGWKRAAFYPGLWGNWLYWLIPAGVLLWRLSPGLRRAEGLLLLMAVIEFLASSLTDVGDMARHLFLFNVLIDLNFLAAVAAVSHSIGRRA